MLGAAGHYEVAPPREDHARCRPQFDDIRRYHMSIGYSDIAYNFTFCDHGQIFTGRGWERMSAANGATPGNYANENFYAFCWMGGIPPERGPSRLALVAFNALVAEARKRGATRVVGHRDLVATSCPGDPFYVYIEAGNFGDVFVPPPVQLPKPSYVFGRRRNTKNMIACWLKWVGTPPGGIVDVYVNGVQTESFVNTGGTAASGWVGPRLAALKDIGVYVRECTDQAEYEVGAFGQPGLRDRLLASGR